MCRNAMPVGRWISSLTVIAVTIGFTPAVHAGEITLGPDLAPVAKVITMGDDGGTLRWIQLRMNFETLLPERLLGWQDYSYRTNEPVVPVMPVVDVSAPLPTRGFSSMNGKFNFNVGYQF